MSTQPLLTIVVPTYQRCSLLRQLVESLMQPGCESISLLISDNASDDSTEEYVRNLKTPFPLKYLRNDTNIGICRNMHQAARAVDTPFQFWITDDDYFFPSSLAPVLKQIQENSDCGYFFSPLSSFSPDGGRHSIIGPSASSFRIEPGPEAVISYAKYGWGYSRQILKTEWIDWDFWDRYLYNSYIPVLISGKIMLDYPSFYDASEIVVHAVDNECHWEEFGDSELAIALRTQADYRDSLPAILQELSDPERHEVSIQKWREGCHESLLRLIDKQLKHMPKSQTYRLLRSVYRSTPSEARDLLRKHGQRWRRHLMRYQIKKKLRESVSLNHLPVIRGQKLSHL